MLETLDTFDKQLFRLINGNGWEWLDPTMLFLSAKWVWLPLYLLILLALIQSHGRKFLVFIGIVALVIVVTDQFTSSFMKPFFERLRPCRDPVLSEFVRLVGRCGGKYGFASSHAANTMGLAVAIVGLTRQKWTYLLLLWSLLVGLSRVYLGVHYPGDVIVGLTIGAVVGFLLVKVSSALLDGSGLNRGSD